MDIQDSSDDAGVMKSRHMLVIGMGMTAMAFIEKLFAYEDKKTGTPGWSVIIVGEEVWMPYNRVGLTQYFVHRSPEDLYLQPQSWFMSHLSGRLSFIIKDPVCQLDTMKRIAWTKSGKGIAYDTCVFATGSKAAVPPYIKSTELDSTEGLFVYRTIDDLERMMNFAAKKPARKVAIIGGGLLGLEAAKAISELDSVSQVTVIERNKWILGRQLDEEGARMVLEQVRALGIEILLGAQVQSVTTSDDDIPVATGLMFEKSHFPCDMIVFAIGIRPRDDLAKSSGIEVDPHGGIVIGSDLSTSIPDTYGIGECAVWNGKSYGFIGPCVEMADVLAYNLTQGSSHRKRSMLTPDASTKLKLIGVNVACFGDYFADTKSLESVDIPGHGKTNKSTPVRALTYHDPFGPVYKKYIFSGDGKYLLGGIMIGDVNEYTKLLAIVRQRKPLEIPPGQLILGIPHTEGEFDGDDLDTTAQVCSCYNVSKGAISESAIAGCKSFGEVKARTKAGTGCGGCVPLATSIFNSAMKNAGHIVMNHICSHFQRSRQDLFMIVKIKELTTFKDIMKEAGKNPYSIGCEICKPAVASILSSIHNEFVMSPAHHQNQDTNDKYLANIQRNGTYSVVPRVSAGEITPTKLQALGTVAQKYGLYTKITGGQRIDLFGANKHDLPDIWEELGLAGFESGHAYGKALRTVKSCVGTTWCRFGVGDSVGLALELEERYKGIRAPHKFKGGVSGCVRECAEAQAKDFGVIASTKGWNIYVGGNGGAKPRHAELLATDVSRKKAIKIIDRFLMLYIRSADRLQRTARWIESLGEGGQNGLEYLKRVIIDDSLGICKDLDEAMDALVGTYFDEWAEVVRSPEKRALFHQFANTNETKEGSELIEERGQLRPPDWPEESSPLKFHLKDILEGNWKWRKVGKLQDLHPTNEGSTSIVINYSDTQIAVFRLASGILYATQQLCPHRRAFVLSDGLLGDTPEGKPYVSCPLHKRNFSLLGGDCISDDKFKIMTFEIREEAGNLYIKLPEPTEMDAILGTSKWMLRKAGEETIERGPSHHIEIVAPTSGPITSALSSGSCLASNKNLDW
ncbi:NADPH nitrite reductase [Gymnopilus junonius]|uniref:Nitrite reductase [NAD(P)H] n=1 Tax=Gymnopilus junonius TaxID=109634 RepID=A0A9P5NP54_GYMJU|nr:NADPH nitrite reductase [Gymnopilus junonius]